MKRNYPFGFQRSLILLAALLLSIPTLRARTIQGEVRSDNDSTVIVGALCRLMSGSQFINGVTTGPDGKFEIDTNVKTALNLQVSMTGYNTTDIVIESGKSINVGTVYLSEGRTLDAVEVTAGSFTDAKGRMIIFPSGADVRASSSSLSLFQKLPLPGLDANPINRSLTVDGGNPYILINGVPSTMEDVNALQPKDIAKIEFTRDTPIRYANSGAKGFLSITLKQRTDGGQVFLWGRSALNTAFMDGSFRASYHQGPSQFTLTYSPSWRNYQKVYDNTTESYIGSDFRVDLESHDRNPFYYHNHKLGLRYNFTPNKKTLFSATFSMLPSYYKSRLFGTTSDSYLGEYENRNLSKDHGLTPSLDLFLRHDFNEKNSLEVEVVGTLSSSTYFRDNDYIFGDDNSTDYITDVKSHRRSLISEVSYIHQFSDKTSFSAGYQNTASYSTNTYLLTDYKPVLTENNNYIYAQIGQQIKRVYVSLSTGAKLYWIKNDQNKSHFISNITTAQLSWTISQPWSVGARFRYSPNIPSLSALTDYQQQLSPYLFSNGNPDLKVAHSFSYSLFPTFRYKNFSATMYLSYNQTDKFTMNDMFYLGDEKFLSQTINARRTWNTYGYVYLRLTGIYGFGANVNLGVEHYETMGDNWCRQLTSFGGSINIWWNKGPFTISYWRKIPSKSLSGNYVDKEENGDALSFTYKPDKHWTIDAGWMYMFDKKGTRYPRWSYSPVNPSYRERYIKNNANMVVLSVSYTADFGSLFRTARRNLNNTDSSSSLLKL